MKATADRIEARRKQLVEAERISKEIDKVFGSPAQKSMDGFYEDLGKRVWECGKAVVMAQLQEELAGVLAMNPDAEPQPAE